MIHIETISKKMHDIGRVIYKNLDQNYYLAGGTALTLLSGHRESVDLDYFIQSHIDTNQLKAQLITLFPNIIITYEEKDTLWCRIDEVKLSFIHRASLLVDTPKDEEGFRIAGVGDIVVMKLKAICEREEYKDYYDLAILSEMTDVREWTTLWQKVYPHSDPLSWIVALPQGGSCEEIKLQGASLRSRKEVLTVLEDVTKEVTNFLK